jgi:hypothetical protein
VFLWSQGKQMPPCLNEMGIHTAVFGNHDFDFGVEVLLDLAHQTNFPWLMSNVYDKATGKPLAGGQITRVFEWNGHKVGLLGLVEIEWLVTLATITPDELDYRDFVVEGKKLVKELRCVGFVFACGCSFACGCLVLCFFVFFFCLFGLVWFGCAELLWSEVVSAVGVLQRPRLRVGDRFDAHAAAQRREACCVSVYMCVCVCVCFCVHVVGYVGSGKGDVYVLLL